MHESWLPSFANTHVCIDDTMTSKTKVNILTDNFDEQIATRNYETLKFHSYSKLRVTFRKQANTERFHSMTGGSQNKGHGIHIGVSNKI